MPSGGGCGLQIRQRAEMSLVSSILTRLRHNAVPMTDSREKPGREVIVCFESAAHAVMAERDIAGRGIPVRVMPMPSSIRAGCGFCLRVLPEDLARAAAVLAERVPAEAYAPAPGGGYRRIPMTAAKGGTDAPGP